MLPIIDFRTHDYRFDLPAGAGSDAVHADPQYGYAVCELLTDGKISGTGITLTLGGGTDLVCRAIELLVEPIVGREIEELMSDFGSFQRGLAEHTAIRWLGPHKGVIHLALAAITNACFDLWAKSRGLPLWRLLLDLSPSEVVALLDLSYLEEVLTRGEAEQIVANQMASRGEREPILQRGYPGYDTSVGWFQYSDRAICDNARRAVADGFTAMKLKVGSPNPDHDVARVEMVRKTVGDDIQIMLDANQAWSLPTALNVCRRLAEVQPYWIEEPTQPDDLAAHRRIADAIGPIPVAVGECIANRVLWKNFLEAGAVGIVQADCTRLAGVAEYLAVAILATRYPVKVIPHAGDMGQIHQHLVLFNHIALGHECHFLEYIPHLEKHFVYPARLIDGAYQLPQAPGASTDIVG